MTLSRAAGLKYNKIFQHKSLLEKHFIVYQFVSSCRPILVYKRMGKLRPGHGKTCLRRRGQSEAELEGDPSFWSVDHSG